jgi:ATP-dependent helicase/nuclease subunit A
LAAILPHPDAKNLREYFGFEGSLRMTNPGFEIKTFVYADQNQIKIPDGQGQKLANQEFDDNPNLSEDIITRLDYEYPSGHLGKFPIKLSVSEAKRMQSEDEEYTPMLKELKINDIRPLEQPQGAEKGTIVHFVLQLANPEEINSAEDIRAMTKRLQEEKTISEVQAMAVEPEKLFKFFDSEIGRRLKKAKRLEREFSFYTKANISDIYDVKHEGEILLQGTMDCFFEEENGNVVLLDFKTDRATDKKAAEVLSKKYKVQMKYYKKALQEILNCEVNECYLYFLDCNETIEI